MLSLLTLLACPSSPTPEPGMAAPPPEPEPILEPASTETATELELPQSSVVTVPITVRPGENLVKLARYAGITAEELAALNGLPVAGGLVAGQEVRVPDDPDFGVRREAAHDARLQDWCADRGGMLGVTTVIVRTGDNATLIARAQGVPLWVLAAFNRSADLARLSIGDTLYLPVVGDALHLYEEEGAEATGPAPINPLD